MVGTTVVTSMTQNPRHGRGTRVDPRDSGLVIFDSYFVFRSVLPVSRVGGSDTLYLSPWGA